MGPSPPPIEYPVTPRATCSALCQGDLSAPGSLEMLCHLIIVDDPDRTDAFSYGFGPGSSGIVVYSGALNALFSSHAELEGSNPGSTGATASDKLACIVAHELAHLVLAHHLETTSTSTVLRPFYFSVTSDIIRTLSSPITLLAGPHITDSLRNVFSVGATAFLETDRTCHEFLLELEADTVSLRFVYG